MRVRGFTLIEMIVTITIMSGVFIAITSFMAKGVEGYVDSVDRERLQQQGRFVIEKMSREIRNAIPNSFDTLTNASSNQKCVTFFPIKYSGFYNWQGVGADLEFIIGQSGVAIGSGDRLIINPSRYDDFTVGSGSNHDISTIDSSVTPYKLNNVTLMSESIANRHYIYNSGDLIQYCLVKGVGTDMATLTRNGNAVADSIRYSGSDFQYTPASLQRGGLIHLDLLFEQNGEQSAYKHDVQVMNVP